MTALKLNEIHIYSTIYIRAYFVRIDLVLLQKFQTLSVAVLCLLPQAFLTLCVDVEPVCRIDKVARVVCSHTCMCVHLSQITHTVVHRPHVRRDDCVRAYGLTCDIFLSYCAAVSN